MEATRATHSVREKFVEDMVRYAPLANSVSCGRLMRLGGTLHRLSVAKSLSPNQAARLERVKAKIVKTCERMQCSALFRDSGLFVAVPNGNELLVVEVPVV